jgi:PleD family two-component response regulator
MSIGVATRAASDIDLEALLARADKALYSAKKEGRDRVVAARGGETLVVGKA